MVTTMKSGTVTQSILKNIATLGFIGYMPVAPGTWGSLAALVFVLLVPLSTKASLLVIFGGAVIGIIAAAAAEKVTGETDSGHIIIDEFIGYLVSVFLVPHSYAYLIAAFFLFRFFDILKPFPIRWVERSFKGGTGVVADDLLAGLFTNMVLQVCIWIF
ncbi:MAG: phosphatidylglycerophosphatase A [Nitrospirae bacterium]|nr:phosphatidylglycerophosphatase A [Nitrospirota bacterium]